MGGPSRSTLPARGRYDLYLRTANGSGADELLYVDDHDKNPTSWSSDGKYLLYDTLGSPQGADLFVLPLTPERPGAPPKPVPFLQTKFEEMWGQFSSD
jgi:Tol biopolymer transport system component